MPRRCRSRMQARLTFDEAAAAGAAGESRVKQVRAEVLSTRKLGAYHSLTLVAPEIAEKARPGQFLAVQMPEGREFLLRRHFAIHQASRRGGWAGTLEFVVDPAGPGTDWLTTAKAHEFLEVIGPLGKAFAYPKTPHELPADRRGARRGVALLPGAGTARATASASTWWWAARRWSACSSRSRPSACRRRSPIMTADGTLGDRGVGARRAPGRWSSARGTEVVYAAAPPPTLERDRRVLPRAEHPRADRGGGADGVRVRSVPDLRRAGGAQGRQRATTTCGRASTARCSTPRACCGIDGCREEPTMLPTPPEGLPVVRSWPG